MYKLEEITQKLRQHPYFEKAKHVKELNPGHPEDSVYVHLVQTADFVREHGSGDFIANKHAKKLFQDFMHREVDGIPFIDIAILTGLVHDIGKILSYKEGEKSPQSTRESRIPSIPTLRIMATTALSLLSQCCAMLAWKKGW